MAARKDSSPRPAETTEWARKAAPPDRLAPLTHPEKRLVACVKRGEPCRFDENRPEDERTLRAVVVERLMRGRKLPGESEALKLPDKGLEISHARLTGELDLEHCTSSSALDLSHCELPERIVLWDARLRALTLYWCSLNGIDGDRLRVEGRLSLAGSTNRRGLRLRGAIVEGELSLRGAALESRDKDGAAPGDALSLDGARIGGSAVLDGLSAKGEVRLPGATVEGNLGLRGATLENIDKDGATAGNALALDGARVRDNAFLDQGFSAKGEVRLLGATLKGDLVLRGARLANTDNDGAAAGDALSLDGARIEGNAYLDQGFSAKGAVRLPGATIEGNLNLYGATLDNTDKDGAAAGNALILQKVTMKGVCVFSGLKAPARGHVDLNSAVLAEIIDDSSLWPKSGHGHLVLDGMVYERFAESRLDWRTRRQWLLRQRPDHLSEDFRPQPWVQCAKVLRDMGHDHDARMLLYEMHEARRRALHLRQHFRRHLAKPFGQHLRNPGMLRRSFWRPLWEWSWSQVLRGTAGHGYRPARAIAWIIGTVLFGWAIFSLAIDRGHMTPAKERFFLDLPRFQEYRLNGVLPDGYPAFSPFIYSLDVFLPIVSFGQEDHWRPANVLFQERLQARWWKPSTWNWYRIYNRLHIVLGWLFTSIAVLAFTGVIKRD